MFNSISATRCFALLTATLCACSGYNLQLAEPGACKTDACGGEAGAGSGRAKDAGSVDSAIRERGSGGDAGTLVSAEEMSSAGAGEAEGGRAGGAGTAGAGENPGAEAGRGGTRSMTDEAAGSSGATGHDDPSAASPRCGDGVREGAELCDGADCPVSCMSDNACVVARLEGSPATCDARCTTVETTMCGAADGCCPKGCDHGTDMDCSPSCGDGVLSGTETCEPGSAEHPCPSDADCDDHDVCTEDSVTGSAQQCSAKCAHQPMMRMPIDCDDGDPCTEDSMVESAAACVYECAHTRSRPEPGNCADSDPCTDDTPVMSASRCAYECPHTRSRPEPGNCADSDPCTDDTPVMSTTSCAFECPHTRRQPTAASCNDNNPCTDDTPVMSTTSCAFECPHQPARAGTPCGGGRMCSADGKCEEPPARCGDGKKQGTEECDDGRETWECDVACHRTRMYTACGSASDCRNGQGCVGGACTVVCALGPSGFTCPSDDIPESALGVVCYLDGEDTTQGYCRPRCRNASDCPSGLTCADNVCL